MTKAAIYARVSTEDQANRDNSIPAQIRAIREYCKKNNLAIYEEYIDEGIFGQKEDRPAFQKMLRDAKNQMFNIILVHKFDRFARKIELSRKIKTQLKTAGINVISITEPIEDSPMGFFVEGLHELLAEYYIKNLAKEVKKGMNERVLKGKHMGQMPYGYKVVNGEAIINEEQAKVVQMIFDLYGQGLGHWKIAKTLNEKNIPTYAGLVGSWQSYQVSKILSNIKYIGKNEWDGKIYDAEFPSIIDESIFYSAQQHLTKQKKQHTYRGDNYQKYVLLGLLRCGECGSTFRIKKSKIWKEKFDYFYMCHKAALYRKGCSFTSLFNNEHLQVEIEEFIKGIMEGTVDNFNVIREKPVDVGDILEDRLKRLDKELQRAKDAYLAEVFTLDEYKATKDKLEKEKTLILDDISKSNTSKTDVDKSELIQKIKNVWHLYSEADTIPEKRKILMMFIKTINIHRDRIEVIFFV
ncbi:recombinase family protein [Anaerosolibacter sp.]|uniref:recombinase family protein n=1 Tax=Anaerosolibacter sp. TaxID=1872527 RepID=UPI0039F00E66